MKKLSTQSIIQIGAGAGLLIFAVVLICIDPSAIRTVIAVDFKDYKFGGNLPGFLTVGAGIFIWLGTRKKEDALADAKKALTDAADNLSGRIGNIQIRIGPSDLQSKLKKLHTEGNLTAKFKVRQNATILGTGTVELFEDPVARVLLADVKGISLDNNNSIEIILTDKVSNNEWSASESIRMRILNFSE